MIPTLLITLREVLEASLIVATVLGMLFKLGKVAHIKTVICAAILALMISFLLVMGGSLIGVHIQHFVEGPLTEGTLSILSALFITWAVFTLHKQFAANKVTLLSTMKDVIVSDGIFLFTFFAVLREGIEIALFLSTLFLTTSTFSIFTGFVGGVVLGITVSLLFFTATIKLPVFWAFRATSYLLILFAGQLLAGGIGDFITLRIIPNTHYIGLSAALAYIFIMHRRVFVHSR